MNTKKILLSLFSILLLNFSISANTLYKNNVTASYYAEAFHGKKTSNGEIFNMYELTCAHKELPFNTILKVTNLRNGKSVNVRVNDRGPFVVGREIDLSKAAAVKLNMIGSGTTKVKLEIVKMGPKTKASVQTAQKAKQMMTQIEKRSTKKTKPTNVKRPSGTNWDIQLGAFKSRENANKKAQALIKAGFSNVVFQTSNNTKLIKVVIKNIDASDLYKIESKLIKAGFDEYTITQRKKK